MVELLITAAVLIFLLLVYGYLSNGMLAVEHYPLSVWGDGEPIKVVMLADLHGSFFGPDNRRLIQRIQREAPDLICMAGDMTVKNGKGTDSCLALCKELLEICPVFYAPGNHEIRMACYEQFIEELKKDDHTCDGYVIVKSNGTVCEYKGYVSCPKYTTKDYEK